MLHLFTSFVAPRGTCGRHGTWNTTLYAVPTYLGVLNLVGPWRLSTVGISKTDFKPQVPMIHPNIYMYRDAFGLCGLSIYPSIGLSSCSYFHGIPSIQALTFRSLKVSVSVSACLFASVSVSAHQLPFISLGMYSKGVLLHSWLLAGRRLCPRHFRHR